MPINILYILSGKKSEMKLRLRLVHLNAVQHIEYLLSYLLF